MMIPHENGQAADHSARNKTPGFYFASRECMIAPIGSILIFPGLNRQQLFRDLTAVRVSCQQSGAVDLMIRFNTQGHRNEPFDRVLPPKTDADLLLQRTVTGKIL